MRWMIVMLVILAWTACTPQAAAVAPSPPRAPIVQTPPSAQLADLGWLEGTWHSPQLDSHWEMVGGALYGIALSDRSYEVNLIDDVDEDGRPGPITLIALENGRDPLRLALTSATPARIELADADHFLRVTKTEHGWHATFIDPAHDPVVIDMAPGELASGKELEGFDRQFAADTAKSGATGWMKWFAPDGAMWHGDGRLEGYDMHHHVIRALEHGSLAWTPVASGERGNTGFTLGTWTYTATGAPAPAEHGNYATIWQRQADSSWKVVFDIGRNAK